VTTLPAKPASGAVWLGWGDAVDGVLRRDLALASEVPNPSPSSGLPWASGAYAAVGAAFEALRGARLDVTLVYTNRLSWSDVLDPWWLSRRVGSSRLEVAVPLWPEDGTVATAAAGGYDVQWGQLAGMLRNGDVVRLGWEMGLPGWYWQVTAANFAQWRTAWGRAYDAIKAANPAVDVCWCVNAPTNATDVDLQMVYVDGKVDIVGVSLYDANPAVTSDTAWASHRAANAVNIASPAVTARGLDAWLAFAKGKGAKFALSGWALRVQSGQAAFGQDNPLFVRHVIRWLWDHRADVYYDTYQSDATSAVRSDLSSSGPAPAATTAYQQEIAGARAPSGSAVVTYGTTRPTGRADITVIFGGDAGVDPLPGDVHLASTVGADPEGPYVAYDTDGVPYVSDVYTPTGQPGTSETPAGTLPDAFYSADTAGSTPVVEEPGGALPASFYTGDV
jgi:hypothetical protein